MLTVANSGQSYQPDMISPVDPQRNERFISERANFRVSAPESRSVSTEEIPLPQPALPNRELPGEVDEYYVCRKQQVPGDGRCAEFAFDTILHEFGIPLTKPEELKPRTIDEIIDLALKKGLKVKRYYVEEFVGNRITSIDNTKAFIIRKPSGPDLFHGVAIVRPDKRERFLPTKDFHESDSGDQVKSRSRRYSGDTAQDALLDYEKQNNVIADTVLTFREIVSADGPGWMYNKGRALFDRNLWSKAIETLDEVITCLKGQEELKQRVLLAKALYTKGSALYKSGFSSKAIEAFDEIITSFRKEADPALRKIVEKAGDNKRALQTIRS